MAHGGKIAGWMFESFYEGWDQWMEFRDGAVDEQYIIIRFIESFNTVYNAQMEGCMKAGGIDGWMNACMDGWVVYILRWFT